MRPLHVYIETSFLGFLLDETEVNRTKREATEQMFEQVREGRLIRYVSDLVFAELAETPHPLTEREYESWLVLQRDQEEVNSPVNWYIA